MFTFSIKRERGITRFHDVCTFCVKNTIPFSAGQKLLHFALKELIHFKSKGVFLSNINRRVVKTAVSLLKPKNYVEILLSVHAQTSQADILHLDQKAAKCSTCKPVCGKF